MDTISRQPIAAAAHYRGQPRWRKAGSLDTVQVGSALRQWLRYPRSLTAALTAACPGRFSVRLLSQACGRPTSDEAVALALPRNSRPVVRQVQLCCDEVPLVFARTVMPRSSLKGPAGHLLRLGTRPLGAVLFADVHVRRGELQVARLQARHPQFALADGGNSVNNRALWARRCVHHLEPGPLLVTEVFLHAIVDACWRPPTLYGHD